VTDPKPSFGGRVFGGPRSVTARIGLYVESDLSMYFQEILQTNLLGLFGFAGNTKIDPILREIQFLLPQISQNFLSFGSSQNFYQNICNAAGVV
jgi:hypothetical protein